MNNTNSTGSDGGQATAHLSPTRLQDGAALDEFRSGADVALVEFFTRGCGVCRSMEPVLGNVARDADVPVGTINPRDDPPLVDRFDVRSVPLFVLFVDGEPVARLADGFVGGDELSSWITEHPPGGYVPVERVTSDGSGRTPPRRRPPGRRSHRTAQCDRAPLTPGGVDGRRMPATPGPQTVPVRVDSGS